MRWKCKVVSGDVLLLVLFRANFGIRTNGKTAQWLFRLGRPFVESLRQQGNRRNEEKNIATIRDNCFGNLQRGKSFSRPASHDEFATAGLLESDLNFAKSLLLMLLDGILFLELDVLRTVDFEVRPVNRALVEVLHAQAADGNLLVGAGVLGVLAPFVRRGNDQASREGSFAGCSKK